jgi:hypothetical protein
MADGGIDGFTVRVDALRGFKDELAGKQGY